MRVAAPVLFFAFILSACDKNEKISGAVPPPPPAPPQIPVTDPILHQSFQGLLDRWGPPVGPPTEVLFKQYQWNHKDYRIIAEVDADDSVLSLVISRLKHEPSLNTDPIPVSEAEFMMLPLAGTGWERQPRNELNQASWRRRDGSIAYLTSGIFNLSSGQWKERYKALKAAKKPDEKAEKL